jgi:N-acetylneuraminic acid mutarotase
VFSLDPASGASEYYGTLDTPAHDAGGAMLGTTVYVFGGGNTRTIARVQALRAGALAGAVSTLPAPRSDHSVVGNGTQAYVVGGFDGTAPSRPVLATSDGVTFRAVAELPDPVRYAAVALAGDSIYVIGGEWAGRATTAIHRVDLSTGTVETAGTLDAGLAHASAFTMGGEVWVLGGVAGGRVSDRVLRFDPVAKTVTAAGTLPQATSDAGVAVVGATAYLVGGENAAGVPVATVVSLVAAS